MAKVEMVTVMCDEDGCEEVFEVDPDDDSACCPKCGSENFTVVESE
jgi:Zn finger protein HypA/HybF involved in hydrogenase expression